jgi:hypothetical protein
MRSTGAGPNPAPHRGAARTSAHGPFAATRWCSVISCRSSRERVLVHPGPSRAHYSPVRPWESPLRYRRGWSALPHHSAPFLQRARFRWAKILASGADADASSAGVAWRGLPTRLVRLAALLTTRSVPTSELTHRPTSRSGVRSKRSCRARSPTRAQRHSPDPRHKEQAGIT